jgi:L-alanine-DL-glutamate epimerase-like enolase superfamily enzyme
MIDRLWIEQIERSHAPVVTSQLTIVGRPALFLHGEMDGRDWVGEASPLEGFGQDSFESARAEVEAITTTQVESAVHALVRHFREEGHCGVLTAWEPVEQIHALGSPSARYCFEMLCARLAAQACHTDLFGLLLPPGAARQLSTSRVLDPLAPDFLAQLAYARGQGIKTFKLKCGRDAQAEITAYNQALRSVEGDVRFRLDANRAYSLAQADVLLAQLDPDRCEWCEDLTDDPTQWDALSRHGIPLAVDEHLVGGVPWAARFAQVLVAKPMALGGMSAVYRLARWAKEHQRTVCVSHLFDGPAAFEATSALAFSLHSFRGAAGLSDHVGLGPPEKPRFPWLFPDRIIVPFSS